MKIIFIIPPNIHYIEPYSFAEADKNNTVRPYLGLLYVAAALRQKTGIETRIIDSNADGLNLDDITGIITAEKSDIVGFSVLTFNLLNCLEVAKIVRKYSPESKICFGGWHPTLYPEETLMQECVDYIVKGEGEDTFSELVKAHIKNPYDFQRKLSEINGLGYKIANGAIKINENRELKKNLDDLSFPAYDLVDSSKYSNLLACSDHTTTIMTSRGCPHRCIFCDLRKTPYRYRSPANILEEIKTLAKSGAKEFFIQDDNFTISRKRTMAFCRLLIESGLNIKYKISSRVDYLDDELIEYLKKSGCYRIYFGVESGSQKILKYLSKGITIDQIENTFRLAKKHGIDRCAYVIIGSYPETREDIDKTLRLIKKIKPEHLHCSICTPMPKTHLYQRLLGEGVIKEDYWLAFAQNPVPTFKTPFYNKFFNAQELRDMQNKIQRRFYFNPMIALREIKKTHGLKQFLMKSKMAFKVLFK
jgi:anaerobic magnesium-protoporphyrin IX monomethyl ester cyclase